MTTVSFRRCRCCAEDEQQDSPSVRMASEAAACFRPSFPVAGGSLLDGGAVRPSLVGVPTQHQSTTVLLPATDHLRPKLAFGVELEDGTASGSHGAAVSRRAAFDEAANGALLVGQVQQIVDIFLCL